MIIVLPPSEGKAPGGDGVWDPSSGRYGHQLATLRRQILDQLTDPDLRPTGAVWAGGATLPAHRRYTGVVWRHLDPDGLSTDAEARARQSVVVASALGGLFGWDDPVPSYKLKMSARTALGTCARLWVPHLSTALAGNTVIDLTALEQSAALARPDGADWIRVELVGPRGERSGHAGKAAKGRLARYLLEGGMDVLDRYVDPDGWTLRLS